MLRTTTRSTLLSLSSFCAAAPIEVITTTFILVTLAYFQLLHAIKGSSFFQLPQALPSPKPVHLVRLSNPLEIDNSPYALPSPPSSRLVNSLTHSENWAPLPIGEFRRVLEANALEGGYVFPAEVGGNTNGDKASVVLLKQLVLVKEDGEGLDEWLHWLMYETGPDIVGKRTAYQDVCFQCNASVVPHPLHPAQSTLTLYFKAPTPETHTLSYINHLNRLPSFTSSSNTTFRILPSGGGSSWGFFPSLDGAGLFAGLGDVTAGQNEREEEELLSGLRNVRWFAYAGRAFVSRFYNLAKNADSADIFVVLLGYVLMHGTFVHLFINMRKIGSNFWLPLATLISSTFAFLTSLLCAHLLNIPIDPVCLSEALPFLVITVGFDKPFRLAQAVFDNPDIAPVAVSPDSPVMEIPDLNGNPDASGLGLDLGALYKELAPLERLQRLAEGKGVRWAAPVAAKHIVRDAVKQVGVKIVRDYAIEIGVLMVGAASGIGGLREFCYLAALIMTADCVFLFSFYVSILSVMVEVHRIKLVRGTPRRTKSRSNLQRDSSQVSIDATREGSPTSSTWPKTADKAIPENPVVRLKLFLIVSFLVLHLLNFCTTLTEQTALRRHSTHSVSMPSPLRIDPRSPTLAPILEALYASLPTNTDLAIQIVPSTNIVMSMDTYSSSRMASIDHFMSEWTQLVGDPVLSKWIVVALGISVLLNGYLLKGIASNSIGGKGPVAAAAQALAGVFEASLSHQPTEKRDWNGSLQLDKSKLAPRDIQKTPRAARFADNIPPTLTHPAPVAAGDLTPKNSERQERVNGDVAGHVVVPAEPRIPVIAEPKANGYHGTSNGNSPMAFGRRSLEECAEIFAGGVGSHNLSDEEVILLVEKGKIAPYALEKALKDLERAVRIRRAVISRVSLTQTLEASALPMADYDYKQIIGACCENVIGFMPLPVGIAGPLNIDGQLIHIPMATTEGTLVASTSRGCKALNAGGGVTTVLTKDAMTRGPAIDFPSVVMACNARIWIDSPEGFSTIKATFDSTSRFARLQTLECAVAGRTLYVRFATSTGDAMGMNMISKGVEKSLETLRERYPEMSVLALSGNYCTDKKPAAINWIEGRGKSIVAEAVVPGKIVSSVLKTTVKDLCNLNIKKNLIGSAMAGSIGGFNAHASNILTAVYLATGQDPAQNVESSMCMTLMEPVNDDQDLLITVSMPSIEVGTVGGGTILSPQRAMLEMLGVAGAHATSPGANAQRLARIIAAAVMAGELSLMSALAAGHLIQAHMKHNRSVPATPGVMTPGIQPFALTPKKKEEGLPSAHAYGQGHSTGLSVPPKMNGFTGLRPNGVQ